VRTLVACALVASLSACEKKPTPGPANGHALREPARAPEPTSGHGFVVHPIKKADGPLARQLQAEADRARAQHLKPFAYISATWCGPCNAIKHNLDQPLLQDAFAGTYQVKIDFDEFETELPAAGLEHPSVPVFFALDDQGKPTGRKIDGGAWGEDRLENMAPPLKAFFQAK
jgi:hypothetical protein